MHPIPTTPTLTSTLYTQYPYKIWDIYHLCRGPPPSYVLGKSHPMMLLEAVTLCFAISIAIAEQPTACEVFL